MGRSRKRRKPHTLIMRINFIVPFVELTGGIKIVFTYANELKKRGHDVVVYFPFIPYKMNSKGLQYSLKFLKHIYRGVFRRNWSVNWYQLDVPYKMVLTINNATIRDANATIATAWPTAYDVYKLTKNKGEKFYFVQHYEIWSGEKEEVDNSYRLPMKKIVIAQWLKDLMERDFNSSATIVHNGIDFADFFPEKKEESDIIRILLLAHPVELKGMDDGIKAVNMLKDRGYNVELVMFGTGYFDRIPHYAEFHCNPSKQELRELYSGSDIYLFPSWSEGWGLTVIEAMACGCAVVGNRVGCLLDIGIHKETAMLSEPHDIKTLSDNIAQLIDNPDLRKYLVENASQEIKKLSWKKSFDAFEDVLYERGGEISESH